MTELSNQSIVFEVEGFAQNTLVVTNLTGTEALSELWEFDLKLVSRDRDLDLEKILYSPVRLGLKQGIEAGGGQALRTRWFDGLLSEFRQEEAGLGWVTYSATMVPKLWLLKEFWRSRILLDQSVKDVIGSVLGGDPSLADGEDFRISLERAPGGGQDAPIYPTHDYIVQYEESDFAFLSRWLEHEGIFYFFENDGEKEEVLFADSTAAYKDSRVSLPYRPSSASGSDQGGENTLYDDEVVRTFQCNAGRLPKRVAVKDYNWRTPERPLSEIKEVKSDGVGLQTEYNDHFKTPDQGKELAVMRKEEFTCRGTTYMASTNCKALRPGKTFAVTDHYRSGFNTTYLVTHVSHEAEQSVDLDAGGVASGSYSNVLTLISAEMSFRPERLTDWPTIHGVMHAKVDAPDTEGDYAEIDDYGRYRITFPFDEAIDPNNEGRRESGPASRYVRLIQPYAGRDSGMHFPLLKGTEVLVTHLDGDPDRPVIVGAVPNPDTMSPVTSANYMKNRIVTTSGNTIEYDDNPERPGIYQFDAARSVVRDSRYPANGAATSGSGGPSGGSGGVQAKSAKSAKSAKGAKSAGADSSQTKPSKAPQRGRASSPRAGVGSPPAVTPVTPPTPFENFTAGQAATDLGITEASVREKAGQVLRKYDELVAGPTPPGMVEMMGNAFSEPMGIAGGGDFDGFLSDVSSNGDQSYTAHATRFAIFARNDVVIKLGTASFVFDDVSNSVSIGTGGYSHSTTVGDSFSETFYNGDQVSSSRNVGLKNSFSLNMSAEHSMSMSLDAKESETMRIGAENSIGVFIGGESSMSMQLSYKNSMSLWVGASTDINIYAALKFSLELGAVAALNIKIVPDKFTLDLPKSTKITVEELEVKLNETEVRLNQTQTNLNTVGTDLAHTKTTLNDTKTELNETKTALNETETRLSQTNTALNETKTQVNRNAVAVYKSNKALANQVQTLAHTVQSGVTTM